MPSPVSFRGLLAPPVPGSARAPAHRSKRPTPARWAPWLLAAPPVLLVGLVVLVLVVLAGGIQQQCASSGAALPGDLDAPGSLGGVGGTGLSPGQVRAVRERSPYRGTRLAAGSYSSTAYGPPWGGIQGAGHSTSGGLVIGGGAPRWYMLAVDPLQIAHGQIVYAWPNPFNWRGPFLAADTGGAILGPRIDFYDWRGRPTQLAWGTRRTRISPTPLKPGGGLTTTAVLAAGACSGPGPDELGNRIGQLARAQLGRGPRIPGFQPPTVGYAWCAWFATNVWRKAGVPIPLSAWSGYPYDWADARDQLFKRIGQPPTGATPPAGSALMYGTNSASDSDHINLVDGVLRDGSFMVTGGNQDSSRVTRYGPCRLSRTDPAFLRGPGCDPRPIYGIATPGPA